MLIVFFLFFIVLIVFNTISCGGSSRTLRDTFYGTYYAEDGVTGEGDKPNSKEAFENCIDCNLGIKVNVHSTRDNKIVISTYDDLSREYGLEKRISESNLDDILSAGIITLDEFLSFVDGDVPVILQLIPGDKNEFLCSSVAETIKESGHINIAVTSFHTGMISWYKKNAKTIFRGLTSAPAKDFISLPAVERFMTGNLLYNSVARPQFVLYRNKKLSPLVKLVFAIGAIKGIWTINSKAEAESFEDSRDMIVIRGFVPDNVNFKDLPDRVVTQLEIDADRKREEKMARRRARREYQLKKEREKRGIDKAFLEAAEDFTEEIEEFAEEVKEEVAEVIREIKD